MWTIEYDNDESGGRWWDLQRDGETVYRAFTKENADALLAMLQARDAALAAASPKGE